jgi:survival-of-motor-neuron-related-splicing factor 30
VDRQVLVQGQDPEYEDSITVDRNAVRPLPSKRKRDPEPAAAPSLAMPVTSTPHIISGPASVNPNSQQANKNIVDEEDVKPKSRIANKGQLKKRQGAWQEFQAKTSKKIPKKESMFRTSTEAGSRGKRFLLARSLRRLLNFLQSASLVLARA